MAIQMSTVTKFFDEFGLGYQEKDSETLVFPFNDDDSGEKVLVALTLGEDGEYLRMRTVKHLDDHVEQASPEKRAALLEWMLYRNYQTKLGTWEYDPNDHDHHISVSMGIEDGDLTKKQLMRMLSVIIDSAKLIPEMKGILGLASSSAEAAKEKKRRELLAQLAELDGKDGI